MRPAGPNSRVSHLRHPDLPYRFGAVAYEERLDLVRPEAGVEIAAEECEDYPRGRRLAVGLVATENVAGSVFGALQCARDNVAAVD